MNFRTESTSSAAESETKITPSIVESDYFAIGDDLKLELWLTTGAIEFRNDYWWDSNQGSCILHITSLWKLSNIMPSYIVRGWYQTMITYWMTASQNWYNSIPTNTRVSYSILWRNYLNTQSLYSELSIRLRISDVRKFWMGTSCQLARQTDLPFKETKDKRHFSIRIYSYDRRHIDESFPSDCYHGYETIWKKDDFVTVVAREFRIKKSAIRGGNSLEESGVTSVGLTIDVF